MATTLHSYKTYICYMVKTFPSLPATINLSLISCLKTQKTPGLPLTLD